MSHDTLDAEAWIRRLGLQPLEFEGGFYRETYRSEESVPDQMRSGKRVLYTAIYYLLTPDTCSALHRLDTDEIFHFYAGDPVRMLQLHDDGSGSIHRLSNSGEADAEPQVLVSRGVWQGSALEAGGSFALMGTTMAPSFELEGFELGSRAELSARYPELTAEIERVTAP